MFLKNSGFTQELTSTVNVLSLVLHSPYIIIESCHFSNTPLHIIPTEQGAKQVLFNIQIFKSKFVKGRRNGDGGALFISSNIEGSYVSLSENVYQNNRAERSFTSGKGGAVYVEGQSLHFTVEECEFFNNSATESGSAIFTTPGVDVVVINSSFQMDQTESTSQPMVTFLGRVIMFTGRFEIESKDPGTYYKGSSIFVIEKVQDNLSLFIHCPPWYKHLFEYQMDLENTFIQTGGKSAEHLHNLIYQYQACPESYYTTAYQENIISYTANGSSSGIKEMPEAKKGCMQCPYGGLCSGNNIIPRPNYWGFWHKGEVSFVQCPAGYCCSGTDTCLSYEYCAGNRTGILCGTCQEGFSVSILSGSCTPDSQCGGEHWFWIVAFLAALAYCLWYTFKDDVFSVFFATMSKLVRICSLSKSKNKESSSDEISVGSNKSDVQGIKNSGRILVPFGPKEVDPNEINSSNIEMEEIKVDFPSVGDTNQDEDVDKGYFGIVTYYVQMAAVIKIHIEFSDIYESESYLDRIVNGIGTALNIELTQMTLIDVCPIVGFNTLGKHIYTFSFLVAIYIAWSCIFLVDVIILKSVNRKESVGKASKMAQSFKIKLIQGITEIIKYTYAGFCGVSFTCLVCAEVGNDYVWWYDGTNVCFEWWQLLVIAFGVFYALPLPIVLFKGMKMLQQGRISSGAFVCCCICPLVGLSSMFIYDSVKSYVGSSNTTIPETSKAIISVLQGPYREDGKHMTLYWEAMVSIRRLVITAMTLVSNASIRMMIVTALSIAFLCQHFHLYPFQVKTSNYIEALSLSLLTLSSVINLLKASFTDSGVVPTGPSIPFFKGLELTEKLFVLILIAYILVIEFKLRKRNRKRKTKKENT